MGLFSARTPAIAPSKPGGSSVAFLEKAEVGGVGQWICARGRDAANPVLLFVHGGPGDAALPLMTGISGALEEDFVVVSWEQRGAGKSYRRFRDDEAVDIDLFVSDLVELSRGLISRFGKRKVLLVGHSWSSVVASLAARRNPELYHAYVGVGQVVDMRRNEALSFDFTLREAVRRGDRRAERLLRGMGRDHSTREDWLRCLLRQRRLLVKYGGAIHGAASYRSFERHFLTAPEYSLPDLARRIRGGAQSLRRLWPRLMEIDLLAAPARFELPFFLAEGRHDFNAPSALAEEYFARVEAPMKELRWFGNSAHFPQWEEPEDFRRFLADIARRTCSGS